MSLNTFKGFRTVCNLHHRGIHRYCDLFSAQFMWMLMVSAEQDRGISLMEVSIRRIGIGFWNCKSITFLKNCMLLILALRVLLKKELTLVLLISPFLCQRLIQKCNKRAPERYRGEDSWDSHFIDHLLKSGLGNYSSWCESLFKFTHDKRALSMLYCDWSWWIYFTWGTSVWAWSWSWTQKQLPGEHSHKKKTEYFHMHVWWVQAIHSSSWCYCGLHFATALAKYKAFVSCANQQFLGGPKGKEYQLHFIKCVIKIPNRTPRN